MGFIFCAFLLPLLSPILTFLSAYLSPRKENKSKKRKQTDFSKLPRKSSVNEFASSHSRSSSHFEAIQIIRTRVTRTSEWTKGQLHLISNNNKLPGVHPQKQQMAPSPIQHYRMRSPAVRRVTVVRWLQQVLPRRLRGNVQRQDV